jgi:hypothetical protein
MKKITRPLYPLLRTLLILACLALPAAFTGCATGNDALPVLTVEVMDGTHFRVEGDDVELAGLPRAVKRAGAGYHTEIRLLTAPTMPSTEILKAYAVLQQAGYLKVAQTHPREATVEIKAPAAAAPAPVPARASSSTRPLKRK